MIKFDNDVPVPKKEFRCKQYAVFDDMQVGQSFFIECEQQAQLQTNILSMKRGLYHGTGIEITTSRRVENGKKGVRVWRIK